MADKKFTQLTAAGGLVPADLLAIAQSPFGAGSSKSVTGQNLLDLSALYFLSLNSGGTIYGGLTSSFNSVYADDNGSGWIIAVGPDTLIYSSDGVSWARGDASFPARNWTSVLTDYSNTGQVIIVCNDGVGNRAAYASSYSGAFTQVATPADSDWASLAYNGSTRIVAVASAGAGNRVMTSDDGGVTWVGRTAAAANEWRSVCWASFISLFVAVSSSGVGNRVMTSPDGITWTARTSAANNEWRSVCWSDDLNLFVAVSSTGVGNRVMTSPDGINWTIRTSAADNDWKGVTWDSNNSVFVAVSSSGTGNRVMTSPDGTTWTIRTSSADRSWSSVVQSQNAGLTIAVAADASATVSKAMTSPDDVAWTNQTTASSIRLPEDFLVTQAAAASALALAQAALPRAGGNMTGGISFSFNPLLNPLTSFYTTPTTLTITSSQIGGGALTITIGPGTYRLSGQVKVQLNGATFAATRTLTVKLRRTNNTATDISDCIATYTVPITTTLTETLAIFNLPEVDYVAVSSSDIIRLFADISTIPSAGTITIDAASISAIRVVVP